MNSTKYSKLKSKKPSGFYQQSIPSKPILKKLLTRLSQSYETCHTKFITELLQNRQRKITQLRQLRHKYIQQNPMLPPSYSSDRFSDQKPISSGQQYLNQKVRDGLIVPDRAFNSQPNVKSGILDRSKMMSLDNNDDKRVINQKFQEFVRIVDEQSGALKRKRLSNLSTETANSNNYSLPVIKSPQKLSMKKTYFKKYPSDQYNFYRPPIKQISRIQKIFELTAQRQSTERSRTKQFSNSNSQSRQIEHSRQSSPRNYRTLEINLSRESSIKNIREAVKTLDASRA